MIMQSSARSAVSLLPRIILFHGTSDYSIPSVERCVTNFIFNIGCMVIHILAVLYDSRYC
jgi:hypothetical protein